MYSLILRVQIPILLSSVMPKNLLLEEEYRKKMIKQKEEYEKWKKEEGDSDLEFNEKDNKEKPRAKS